MKLTPCRTCDVLVVGAGLAGVRAALAAAQTGRRVILASQGPTLSGSSFYPGTWGLGLIGPSSPEDEADLTASILEMGRGMADPVLTASFVQGITPAVEELLSLGAELKRAEQGEQREFIPCFDRKHRAWYGLLFASLREVFRRELDRLGVECLAGTSLLELSQEEGRITGGVFGPEDSPRWIRSGSVVLACGGLGGLYRHRLTTGDVVSSAHWLALKAGAQLINLEFMQMMPGYVTPCPKTIFNERVFRWTQFRDNAGQDILADLDAPALLAQRSGHGPFTSRLADRAVDLAILRHQGEEGVFTQYKPELKEDMPEFVHTYFDWLKEEKGLTVDDPIRIAIFAHAANGGIRIDASGSTGVPGLYAAGEVTGGMHGADRIGGLSTANGLVFGARAGKSAAEAVECSKMQKLEFIPRRAQDEGARREALGRLMTRHALVCRSQKGLEQGLEELTALEAGALSHTLEAQIGTARCVLTAQLARTESRGSHYREDFPQEDPAQNVPNILRLEGGILKMERKQTI